MTNTNNEVIVTDTVVEGMPAFEDMYVGVTSVMNLFKSLILYSNEEHVTEFSPFLSKKTDPTTEFKWILSFVDPGDTTKRAVFTFAKHYVQAHPTQGPNDD